MKVVADDIASPGDRHCYDAFKTGTRGAIPVREDVIERVVEISPDCYAGVDIVAPKLQLVAANDRVGTSTMMQEWSTQEKSLLRTIVRSPA